MPGDKSKIYIDIKSQYGMETLRVFRKLMSRGKKVAKHRGHLFYNHSYIRKGILPRSLQFKSINTAAGKKLAKKFGFKYLKLRINESHYWIRNYEARISSILHQFSAFMPEKSLNVIKLRIKSMKQKIYADLLSYYEKSLKNN